MKFSLALQITRVVHAEYDETMVPTLFRPLLRSGNAFGAQRWLASLQRQYEYLAVLHSSQVPRGDNDNNTGESCHGQQGNCPYLTFDFIFHVSVLYFMNQYFDEPTWMCKTSHAVLCFFRDAWGVSFGSKITRLMWQTCVCCTLYFLQMETAVLACRTREVEELQHQYTVAELMTDQQS